MSILIELLFALILGFAPAPVAAVATTDAPTAAPTAEPTAAPTAAPTAVPTAAPAVLATCTAITVDIGEPSMVGIFVVPAGVVAPSEDQYHSFDAATDGPAALAIPGPGTWAWSVSYTTGPEGAAVALEGVLSCP